MSVAGKKQDEWVAVTLCDFGEPGRRDKISHHFSIEAAWRRYHTINKIYGRNGWRCWQENRTGQIIAGKHSTNA